MIPAIFLAVTVLLLVACIFTLHRAWVRADSPGLGFALIFIFFVSFGLFVITGKYVAGRGDSLKYAEEWLERWRPEGEVECQGMDYNDDGYVHCTVGWRDDNGYTHVEPIECGVNRWYHGWRHEGCFQVFRPTNNDREY